jgi:hypothetical protein
LLSVPETDSLLPPCGNSDEGMAGNRNPIVHTADAFDPTAPEAARYETA